MAEDKPTRKEINAVEDKLKEYNFEEKYLKNTEMADRMAEIFKFIISDGDQHDIVKKTREWTKDLGTRVLNHINGMSSQIIKDCFEAFEKAELSN